MTGPAIALKSVDSSLIRAAGYDATSRTLEVQFVKGSRWQYYNVPPNVAAEMFQAESVGRFFLQNIRGQYDDRTV